MEGPGNCGVHRKKPTGVPSALWAGMLLTDPPAAGPLRSENREATGLPPPRNMVRSIIRTVMK
jgi:hypothetical protein